MSRRRPCRKWRHLTEGPLDVASLMSEELEAARSGFAGALALFVGVVKFSSEEGKEVKELFLEAYEELADEVLAKICRDLEKKYGLSRARIVHSVGVARPGDPIVFVAVHARSRREAFEALQEAVRKYKTEPPLFKKEVYINGTSKWIEETKT